MWSGGRRYAGSEDAVCFDIGIDSRSRSRPDGAVRPRGTGTEAEPARRKAVECGQRAKGEGDSGGGSSVFSPTFTTASRPPQPVGRLLSPHARQVSYLTSLTVRRTRVPRPPELHPCAPAQPTPRVAGRSQRRTSVAARTSGPVPRRWRQPLRPSTPAPVSRVVADSALPPSPTAAAFAARSPSCRASHYGSRLDRCVFVRTRNLASQLKLQPATRAPSTSCLGQAAARTNAGLLLHREARPRRNHHRCFPKVQPSSDIRIVRYRASTDDPGAKRCLRL